MTDYNAIRTGPRFDISDLGDFVEPGEEDTVPAHGHVWSPANAPRDPEPPVVADGGIQRFEAALRVCEAALDHVNQLGLPRCKIPAGILEETARNIVLGLKKEGLL